MKDVTSTSSGMVTAHVTEAPALMGTPMFALKISCKGHSSSMFKSREDFKSVLNMFKLAHGMARNRGTPCAVCAQCSAISMVRVCDVVALDEFIQSVLLALRKLPREALLECSAHRGVVYILMEFLGITSGKYFSEPEECDSPCDATVTATGAATSSPGADTVQDNDLEHPTEHFALLRSISDQFAAMDSVC